MSCYIGSAPSGRGDKYGASGFFLWSHLWPKWECNVRLCLSVGNTGALMTPSLKKELTGNRGVRTTSWPSPQERTDYLLFYGRGFRPKPPQLLPLKRMVTQCHGSRVSVGVTSQRQRQPLLHLPGGAFPGLLGWGSSSKASTSLLHLT